MTTEELVTLIKQANRQPIERGTLYNVIKDYSN
jgi:aminodeoxyfutalosine synthase